MDEQVLPIDIHVNKLFDWLISRRHCNKDAQSKLEIIREKLKVAIQDMPAHEKIREILSGTHLNYYNCLLILEILRKTESDSKNIFGFYSSQRFKDWQEIIKLYEKDNIYLIESALIMSRNVRYEIPSLRKQINRFDLLEEDFLKKSKEFLKQSKVIKSDYKNFAKKLGIEGENIIKELTQLVEEFPNYLKFVLTEISNLSESCEYYTEFLKVVHKRDDADCTPILKSLLKNGNITYFQFRTGNAPHIIEKPTLEMPSSILDATINEKQIDFGDVIEIVDDTENSSNTNGNSDFVHISKDDCIQEDSEINWDIESFEEPTEERNDAQSIATGNDALPLLEYHATFKSFINELYELEGFYDQRIYELQNDTNIFASNQIFEESSFFYLNTPDKLAIKLEKIREVLNILTTDKVKLILTIKENPKYIYVVESKFKNKLLMIDKALEKSKLMEAKAAEVKAKSESLKVQIPLLIKQTQEIQKLVEANISKRYKNRPVNIMGAIQTLDLV